MEITLRTAEINDSEFIAELTKQLGYVASKEQIEKRIHAILKDKAHCVFVALQNEKVVGWIHAFSALRVETGAFVEIGGLVVDEQKRKMGIGKMLLEKVNEWALSKKHKMLRVRSNAIRKESHIFYVQLGFHLSKTQKVYDKKLN